MAESEEEGERQAPRTPSLDVAGLPQQSLLPALSVPDQDTIKPSTADRENSKPSTAERPNTKPSTAERPNTKPSTAERPNTKPSTADKSKPSTSEKSTKPAAATAGVKSRPVTAIDVTEASAASAQAAAGPDAGSGPAAFLASPSGAAAPGASLQRQDSAQALPSLQTALLLSPRGEVANKGTKAASTVTFATKAKAVSRSLELDPSTSSFLAAAPVPARPSQTFGLHPSLHPQPAEVRHQLTAALATLNPMALSIPSANLIALNQRSGGPTPRPGHLTSRPAVTIAAEVHTDRPATAAAPGPGPHNRPPSSAPGAAPGAQQAAGPRPGSQPPPSPRLMSPAVKSLTLGAVGGRKLPSSCSRSGLSSQGSSQGGVRLSRDGVLAKRPHPMESFRPSRAQLLVVFNSIDADKTGKLTQANLEEACISLGFSLQNAHSMYERLDVGRKGFVTHAEWGSQDIRNTIEMFTLYYMRQFLGLPDTSASPVEVQSYFRKQEQSRVKSLPVALDLLRANAVTRGSKAAMRTGDAIYDAFCFIDSDHSGTLSKSELMDGFSVMGVRISASVADEILRLFDRNGNGTVEYYEFVKTMFPR